MMNIGGIHSALPAYSIQQQQAVTNQQQQSSALDNDGDHDHGAPDATRGRNIDIKA